MKLTSLYLHSMISFYNHVKDLSGTPPATYLDPFERYASYFTCRLDFGRQTGKTTAASQMVVELLEKDCYVVYLTHNYQMAREAKERITHQAKRYQGVRNVNTNNVYYGAVRNWLSYNRHDKHWRGRSFDRVVFIIDEPLAPVDMAKIHANYRDSILDDVSVITNKDPLFYVIGMQ